MRTDSERKFVCLCRPNPARKSRGARLERYSMESSVVMDSLVVETDDKYMKEAIKLAKRAAKRGDVPIGCVIVHEGKIIAKGYNKRNYKKSTLAHAELVAIEKACKVMGDWRLEGCTMYITLEPCQMCAGAIIQARFDRVVIGAMNKKAGCAGSILNLFSVKEFNHQVVTTYGVMEEECSHMMSEFFRELRRK